MKNRLLFSKLRLIYNTIRPLKLRQIYSFISLFFKTHLLKNIIIRKTAKVYPINTLDKIQLQPKPNLDYQHDLSSKTFIFLNQRIHFENQIEWNKSDIEKLWLYNLHYFDYLINLTNQVDEENYITAKEIIEEWIENNPIGYGNGWEPYPISLRLVNWIYFYYFYNQFFEEDDNFKNKFLGSLYQQCYYLTYFVEYHLLANHLFKNGKAIFITGLVFNNNKWLKIGYNIIEKELHEQVLSDGGHFERSAMYHAIILEDILDLINFMKSFQIDLLLVTFTDLQQKAKDMLKWLINMIHPDGDIPLFGDAALNSAMTYDQLNDYYQRIFKNSHHDEVVADFMSLPDSGYFTFRSPEQVLIIDGGELGVSYQPGHAHCDLLSFEYSYAGKRFFVDSGVGNYLQNNLRKNARSIKSHNTVRVNELEQGEIWAAFRMGKRVTPAEIKYFSGHDSQHFIGTYENLLRQSENYRHKRSVTFYKGVLFVIEDRITGKNINTIESFFHLHPDVQSKINKQRIDFIYRDSELVVYLKQPYFVKNEKWFYSPEFGKVEDSVLLIISPTVKADSTLSYILVPRKYDEVACEYITKNWQNWI